MLRGEPLPFCSAPRCRRDGSFRHEMVRMGRLIEGLLYSRIVLDLTIAAKTHVRCPAVVHDGSSGEASCLETCRRSGAFPRHDALSWLLARFKARQEPSGRRQCLPTCTRVIQSPPSQCRSWESKTSHINNSGPFLRPQDPLLEMLLNGVRHPAAKSWDLGSRS
jgi:hypothetical protein